MSSEPCIIIITSLSLSTSSNQVRDVPVASDMAVLLLWILLISSPVGMSSSSQRFNSLFRRSMEWMFQNFILIGGLTTEKNTYPSLVKISEAIMIKFGRNEKI